MTSTRLSVKNGLGLVALLGSMLLAQPVYAQNSVKGEVSRGQHAKTRPLREITPLKENEEEGHHEKPLRLIVHNPSGPVNDPVIQGAGMSTAAASVGNVVSFDGLGVGGGYTPNAAPPDTNGAVGATQYVQWVNESFAVYDKATGAKIYGPAAGNTVFQALGATHPCAVHNDGDPIAQYDKAAGRWVLTQFSVTSGSSQGYWQCVAVSTSSDATGSYNVYAFDYGTVQFNDYPKIGMWNTGYYTTYNIFNNGNTFAGSKLCALDRTSMLNGAAANQVCFQLSNAYGGVLPADLDGSTPPPAGSPEYFVAFGTNSLLMWELSAVNFTSGTATLSSPITIPVAAFSAACSGGGTCIPQATTTQKLDSLADRLMYRLAYRNFGDHEALVVNHAVTAGTSVGVRWYELRNLSTTPMVYQQGTFAPDSNYRWMGSAAMDSAGNLAIGYSVSSSTMAPSIRFTGRAPTDTLGTLATPEIVIKDGTGSQTTGLSRWGDYSALSIDPTDDCTMWYTTEYLQNNGTFNWSTRIGYFKFAGCGGVTNPDFTVSSTPTSQSVVQGSGTSYTVNVGATGGFNGTVNLTVSGLPTGASGSFNPASVNTSGASTLSMTTASTVAPGSYPLTITGTSGSIVHTSSATLVVTTAPQPDFSLSATPSSQSVVQGSGTTYSAKVSPVNGYTGTVSFSVSGLPTGATASFNPTSVAGSGNSTLTVNTLSTTPGGSYTLTVTGSDGTITHTTTVTLVVTTAAADFSFSVTPSSQTVRRRSSTSFTVTVGKINGFTGTVTFSVTGLPTRTSSSFGPSSVTGSGTSTLKISPNQNAGVGQYVLTVKGTSGSLTHTAQVTITIQ